MLPLTSRMSSEAHLTPPGLVSISKMRPLAKLQDPLRLRHSVTNLHEGGFGKLILKLIERLVLLHGELNYGSEQFIS